MLIFSFPSTLKTGAIRREVHFGLGGKGVGEPLDEKTVGLVKLGGAMGTSREGAVHAAGMRSDDSLASTS